MAQFTLVQQPTAAASSLRPSSRWIQTTSRRLHSHDVRALALWPPYSPLPRTHVGSPYGFSADVAPILASGGLDASLVLTPAALARATTRFLVNPIATSTTGAFEDAYHRRVAYARAEGGSGMLRLAHQARILMCVRDAGVGLWRLQPRKSPLMGDLDLGSSTPAGDGWEKLLEMDLSVQTNTVTGAISDDARWLAVSDTYETKLFAVHHDVRILLVFGVGCCSDAVGPIGIGALEASSRQRLFGYTTNSLTILEPRRRSNWSYCTCILTGFLKVYNCHGELSTCRRC